MDTKNLSIVRQSFANTVFTHKTQEVACDFQNEKADKIRKFNILLVSIVLVALVLQVIFPKLILLSYLGISITLTEIIFLIIQLSYSFEQKAILHKNSALKFMDLRDNYSLLITDIMNESIDTNTIINKRDNLQHQYQVICDLAPRTGQAEYDETQISLNKKGIVRGEQFTWSDEEIDRFLPENLRLNKK